MKTKWLYLPGFGALILALAILVTVFEHSNLTDSAKGIFFYALVMSAFVAILLFDGAKRGNKK